VAFKRLIVDRSPVLVWIGAILAIFTFAGMQASSGARFWRPQYLEPIGYVYLAVMLLGVYFIFRGLYGAWWREIKIDLDARKLKTCMGEVLSLDGLGELTRDKTGLHAANAKTPLYRSLAADVERVHVLLDGILKPGAPKYLYRLRRLTYHRSIGLFIFTLIGFSMLVGVFIGESHTTMRSFSYEPEYKLMLLLGLGVSFMWFRRALFGTFSKSQLFVDPIAGILQLEDGRIKHFDELGELSIVEGGSRVGRHFIKDYFLKASKLDGWLFSSQERPRTEKRLAALETARLQHALRRALEAPVIEGDAFRSGLDPKDEAKRIAGSSPHKQAALAALARDPDPTVRSRAKALS
jgi:hypothetical protein